MAMLAAKQNQDETMVNEVQTALNAAQVTFDTKEQAAREAKFYFEKLRDQQQQDARARTEELMNAANAEREGRETAMMAAVDAWSAKNDLITAK